MTVPAGLTPPWWVITADEHVAESVAERTPAGLVVGVLPGRRMTDADGVFGEFAAAWRFPEWFGRNWSALEDCLGDLSWSPARAYLCVIADADRLLLDAAPPVLGLFLDLLDRVGRQWAAPVDLGEPWDRPAAPFHTALLCPDDVRRRGLRARVAAARAISTDG